MLSRKLVWVSKLKVSEGGGWVSKKKGVLKKYIYTGNSHIPLTVGKMIFLFHR